MEGSIAWSPVNRKMCAATMSMMSNVLCAPGGSAQNSACGSWLASAFVASNGTKRLPEEMPVPGVTRGFTENQVGQRALAPRSVDLVQLRSDGLRAETPRKIGHSRENRAAAPGSTNTVTRSGYTAANERHTAAPSAAPTSAALFDTGIVENRLEVRHTFFEGENLGDRIGQARPAPIPKHDAHRLSQMREDGGDEACRVVVCPTLLTVTPGR